MRSLQFRHDINALRAVAVLAVVLFHYKVGIFRGGFVGVDIFFVISGYLMTAIITRRLEKGAFSVFGFYGDRARRIVPPLVGLILALLVFGYFFIDPYNYEKLASSGVSALLFYSNIQFWQGTGYFLPSAYTKWLLHTWSLSVEWQFYIIYPIIMLALYRVVTARRWMVLMLWGLTLASFAASVCFSKSFPTSTFYLLPFRGWELLAGGIVALQFNDEGTRDKRLSYALLAVGLAMILYAIFSFNEATPWPYYWAAIPVLGTCLVIAARQTEIRLFKNPACNLLGEWSYSIYLWHWPIAVAAYYSGYIHTTPLKVICELVILAGLIGFGGYLVTMLQNLWKSWAAGWPAPARALTAVGVFLLALGANITVSADDGLVNRMAGGSRSINAFTQATTDFVFPGNCDGPGGDGTVRPCRVGQGNGDGGVLFIGDSQTMQIYAHFTAAMAQKYKTSFTFLAAHGCAPVPGIGQTFASELPCGDFMTKAFNFAEAGNYSRIVLVSRWSYIQNVSNLDSTLASLSGRLIALTKRGVKVVILSSTPVPELDLPQELLRRKFFGYSTGDIEYEDRATFEKELLRIKPRLKWLAETTGADLVDPFDYLCDEHHCPLLDANQESLYSDQSHYRGRSVKGPLFKFLDGVAGLEETAQRHASETP
ncbi:acyltransferase family protein [Methyloferula stellata]|uniref:acyltransferase family protein n=1 Tax=Methyloferula stellata TaxID=876270 RepID=UPI00036253BD|nr:acyltransferase family protein [Methyloferula stellata]